jgi:hypothetical protein
MPFDILIPFSRLPARAWLSGREEELGRLAQSDVEAIWMQPTKGQ